MKKLTRKVVNAALRSAGHNAEVHIGHGYIYFTGPGLERWPSTSVFVPRLSDLTRDRWVREFEELARSYK